MGSAYPRFWIDDANVPSDDQDHYLRVHCVNVYVRDYEVSLRFYLDQLGFSMAYDATLPDGDRWVAVTPPNGAAVLTLLATKQGCEEHQFIGRPRLVAFATDDVAAMYEEWFGRGVKFDHPPQEELWGGKFTRFQDPDGNSFSLVSHNEITRAIEGQRRAMAQRREAERRMIQELEIAKQVQARLFPQVLPRIKTLDYAGECIQARQVGGDYYDFLDLGRQRFGLIVGDISGKGIAAALLMAHLQANLRSQSSLAWDQPRSLLQSVNHIFCENTADSSYATLFFAEYDDVARRLRYVNCGHLAALLLRADNSIERLDSTGTVIGLFNQWDCAVEERQIFPGDILVLYTDGVTESFSSQEEEFGECRLTQALVAHRDQPPQKLLESILADLKQFSAADQQDDITLIVAKGR